MDKLVVELLDDFGDSPLIQKALKELNDSCSATGMAIESGRGRSVNLLVQTGESGAKDQEGFGLSKKTGKKWRIIGASELGCARGLTYLSEGIRSMGGRAPHGWQ